MTKPGDPLRVRINIKQSAKGTHYVDVTTEHSGDWVEVSRNKDDPADTEQVPSGLYALRKLKETEAALRNDGRRLAIDE